MNPPHGRVIVVVGTGTDVGKTHVTAALARRLRARGARIGAWKPIASGLDDSGGDGGALARALDEPYDPPAYGFSLPLSPHLAAAREGATIDLARICVGARERAGKAAHLLVETAGGLFSPLAAHVTNADLARALEPAAILLVAPDRLGVLHDVTAVLRAAQGEGLRIDALALSAPPISDASTGSNARELASLQIRDVDAVFPRASLDDPATLLAADATWAALGRVI